MAAQTSILLPDHSHRLELLHQAAALVNKLFSDFSDWPVYRNPSSAQIRQQLMEFNFEQSMPPSQVIDTVFALLRDHGLMVSHPRSFGLFNPTPSFMGVIADLLVAAFNPQTGAWHQNPAAVEMERHLIQFFAGRFGLSSDAYGHFTSGGSEANMSGVVVALTRIFPTFARTGLRGLEGQPRLYCSAEFHHSFEKIAHQCGLGRDAVRLIKVAVNGGLDAAALAEAIKQDRAQGDQPFLVVGTAGTTNAGAIDPLPAMAQLCRQQGLHFHVDAAWGGSVILSPRSRGLLKGIEQADSITFDPHKMLSVPMGAGMFLCANKADLEASFGLDAAYVPKSDVEGMDNYQLSAQFSRRFIGLKLLMTLATIGEDGYAQTIERQIAMGRYLAQRLTEHGWQVVNDPRLALVCFEHVNYAEHEDAEAIYRVIARHVVASGEAWVSTTRIGGRPVMRACVTSYLTDESDIDRAVIALDQAHLAGQAC